MYQTARFVSGIVHSEETKGVQQFRIERSVDDGSYIAFIERDGVITECTAIFNPFTCLYYADDRYGVIDTYDVDDIDE